MEAVAGEETAAAAAAVAPVQGTGQKHLGAVQPSQQMAGSCTTHAGALLAEDRAVQYKYPSMHLACKLCTVLI